MSATTDGGGDPDGGVGLGSHRSTKHHRRSWKPSSWFSPPAGHQGSSSNNGQPAESRNSPKPFGIKHSRTFARLPDHYSLVSSSTASLSPSPTSPAFGPSTTTVIAAKSGTERPGLLGGAFPLAPSPSPPPLPQTPSTEMEKNKINMQSSTSASMLGLDLGGPGIGMGMGRGYHGGGEGGGGNGQEGIELPTLRAVPRSNNNLDSDESGVLGEVESGMLGLGSRRGDNTAAANGGDGTLFGATTAMPAAGSGLPPRTGTGLGGGFMREPVHSRFLENFDWEEEKRGLGGYNPSNIGADGNDPQDPPDGSSTPWENHGRSSRAVVIALWVLSIFSTIGSFIWLVLAIWQPRWGKRITSSGAPDTIAPSTASLIVALLAKLIESAFVAVFVAFVGQVLTKRAFAGDARAEGGKKGGVTLAEISMRNWVIQPGLMITDGVALRYAILTGLGLLSVVATLGGVLYTTASDALVSPKLKFGGWESTVLESYAMASYASLPFLKESCGTPIDKSADPHSQSACVAVSFAGASYHNFQTFMSAWYDHSLNQTNTTVKFDKNCMAGRPPATVILYDNITLTAAWIETQYADPKRNYEIHNRTINNVTLAMPHPGIYLAATDPINNILQPSDLSGLGEYLIRASAVSPAVNVLCVNLTPDELSPLVYTEWPHAKMYADEHGRKRPNVNWKADIPPAPGDEWLNRTVVDDIFGWGPNHGRRPPIFPKFPLEFNLMYNASVYKSDAVYVLGKSNSIKDYTLCSMRSWLSPVCSTHFNVSGTTGAHMRAHCEDPDDSVAYMRSVPNAPNPGMPQHDWRDVADEWGLALYMDSGSLDGQASKDRILTQMVLVDPDEGWTGGKRLMPSLAEGLAVLVGETLVAGALRAPVVHWWGEDDVEMVGQEGRGVGRRFNASMKRMQYTSTYESGWQGVFYAVLGVVFVLNVVCLGYFVKEGVFGSGCCWRKKRKGWGMRDYTDPANMFLLAVNSTPEGIGQLPGESGGEGMGRKATAVVKMNKELLRMPWSIGHDEGDDVYFFRPGKTAASASTGNDGGSSRSGGMRKRLGHVCRRSRGGPKVDTSGAAHMGGGSAAIAATTDGCGGCGRRSETGTEDDEFSLIADIESQNQRHLHSQGGGSGGGGGYSSTSESSNHKWY